MIEIGEMNRFKRYAVRNLEKVTENLRGLMLKNITQSILIIDVAGIDRDKHLCLQCIEAATYLIRIYENYYPQLHYITYVINCKFSLEICVVKL